MGKMVIPQNFISAQRQNFLDAKKADAEEAKKAKKAEPEEPAEKKKK